jgi:hypothetical protein
MAKTLFMLIYASACFWAWILYSGVRMAQQVMGAGG